MHRRLSPLEQTAEAGILAGIAAALPMVLFAMIASATYQGRGLFTPMYHIAFVVDPDTFPTSLKAASVGDVAFFRNQPFFFGFAIHVFVGGFYGLIFGLTGRALRQLPQGRAAVAAGVVYGLVVMAFMSLVVLPYAGSLFGAGRPISDMGGEVGWVTFALQHAIYGAGLGVWLRWRPQDVGLELASPKFQAPAPGSRRADLS